jgi:methylenetetrahydrofolate reductase (NADPH)
MKIIDKLTAATPAFSFEYFPPKNADGMRELYQTIQRLRRYEPAFVSVTYGAGGSTRELTVELVRRIKAETGLETMAHLTCLGATQDELRTVLGRLCDANIENVLALRGDPPRGAATFTRTPGGFAHASELIGLIRSDYDFCIAAACYPEKHPEAPDLATDLRFLERKVEAGADFLITQLFFDNRDYFAFVRKARALGIHQPIIPGIMPITNVSQIRRFSAMCGAHLPADLLARLEEAGGDCETIHAIGVAHAIEQCRALLDAGVPGIHFYTLNRSPATVRVLEAVRALGAISSRERASGSFPAR